MVSLFVLHTAVISSTFPYALYPIVGLIHVHALELAIRMHQWCLHRGFLMDL